MLEENTLHNKIKGFVRLTSTEKSDRIESCEQAEQLRVRPERGPHEESPSPKGKNNG